MMESHGRPPSQPHAPTAAVGVDTMLSTILKRYDRIGFGRRGVLDAEPDICRLAAGLSPDDHACLRRIILSWITAEEAERVTAPLHYNLSEHLQALAIRLCASVPIPESLPLLRQLQANGAFDSDDVRLCSEALRASLARVGAG